MATKPARCAASCTESLKSKRLLLGLVQLAAGEELGDRHRGERGQTGTEEADAVVEFAGRAAVLLGTVDVEDVAEHDDLVVADFPGPGARRRGVPVGRTPGPAGPGRAGVPRRRWRRSGRGPGVCPDRRWPGRSCRGRSPVPVGPSPVTVPSSRTARSAGSRWPAAGGNGCRPRPGRRRCRDARTAAPAAAARLAGARHHSPTATRSTCASRRSSPAPTRRSPPSMSAAGCGPLANGQTR